MLKRARQLVHSDYGRDFGWFVEYENRVVGELDDRRVAIRSGDTYRITPASRDAEAILLNDDLCKSSRFCLPNRVMNAYAAHAMCGGPPFIVKGRVDMRGLYLEPKSSIEQAAVICMRKFFTRGRGPE